MKTAEATLARQQATFARTSEESHGAETSSTELVRVFEN